jgi:predicted Zn-dependent peptidase
LGFGKGGIMKTLRKRLACGARLELVQRPGYVRSVFLAGFGVGGMNIEEFQDGQFVRYPAGCAHYLEHQMFNYQGQDVTERFAAMRTQSNAFTSYRETAYSISTTGNLEGPVQLLLDFVQDLDISEETIEKERGIILSEYYGYDQNPEYRLIQDAFESAYAHYPLRRDILGDPQDIQNMTKKDLDDFYQAHYDPSQLVIAGVTGQDLEQTAALFEKAQAKHVSRHPKTIKRTWGSEPKEVARPYFARKMDVSMPYVCLIWKFEPKGDVLDNLFRDLCLSIWLDALMGPVNPDYQRWLDERMISAAAGAEADLTPEHGYMLFYAQTKRPEAFVQEMKALIASRPRISEDVFQGLRMDQEARSLRALDHFESLAQDVFRASLEGYDWQAAANLISELTLEDVHKVVDSLNFENVAVCRIDPLEQGDFE